MYSLSRKTNYLASEEANSCISKSSLSFLGFTMVKIHLLQKVLKNGLVSEKNNLFFFINISHSKLNISNSLDFNYVEPCLDLIKLKLQLHY